MAMTLLFPSFLFYNTIKVKKKQVSPQYLI
nr:MAG TPA: hypothetical protein [Caudoviricetes sp.]